MSSALAIGAVSAVLKNLLDNGIVEQVALGTTVNVSAVAPDTIRLDAPEDPPQLNVFLHQVTPNAAWRNRELPSRAANGDRLTNPPLALDLHYLITAYGRSDFQAEILLGYAMHLLHERPMLDRPAIRRALDPSPLDVSMLPPAFQMLTASDLADQVEAIRITPIAMAVDEMSKLWSAFQTHYRPSAAYQVSVVLIDAKKPARNPLPVLSRGLVDPVSHRDRGVVVNADMLPPLPTLFDAKPPAEQVVARLGESIDSERHPADWYGHHRVARAPAGDDTHRGAGHAERERQWIHVDAAKRRGGADHLRARTVAAECSSHADGRTESAGDERHRIADRR